MSNAASAKQPIARPVGPADVGTGGDRETAVPWTPSHHLFDIMRPRVQSALDALRAGDFIVVAEDRPGGVAMVAMAGCLATPDKINELVLHAAGVVAATVDASRAVGLDLGLIPRRRAADWVAQYAISVEAAVGVSTGISAADRSATILALCHPDTIATDLVRPGHVMPILVNALGTLRRPYAPEIAHDLVRAAGLDGGAAIAHVLSGNGELLAADADAFAAELGWPVVRASEIATYRAATEELIARVEGGEVETASGPFRVEIFESQLDHAPHIALVFGAIEADASDAEAPLVRVHSQCLTGDVLHSARCDCGEQLRSSMAKISASGRGALLYLSQEGRGIGLVGKVQAYALQDAGRDTVDANLELGFAVDQRDYAVAAQLLRRIGWHQVRLLTNNPEKVGGLERLGIQVVERVPLEISPSDDNYAYLQTKRDRLGHQFGGQAWGKATKGTGALADDQRER